MTEILELKNNESALIKLEKDFNVDNYKYFNNCIQECLENEVKLIVLDFEDVDYIDSIALGVLTISKKEALEKECEIKIKNANGNALEILEIAGFNKRFEFI